MPRGGVRQGAGRKRKEYHFPGDAIKMETQPAIAERDEFTREQMKQLRESPCVRKVTNKTVSYTVEFKELFWKRYNEGTTPPQIFEESGLDVDVLGDTRVYGLLTMLRRTKQLDVPFTDGREPRQPRQKEQPDDSLPKPPRMPPSKKLIIGNIDETEIRRLVHQVAFLTQEMEFLKKIISLEKRGEQK